MTSLPPFRSDVLLSVRELREFFPGLKTVLPWMPQVRGVVDTNALLQESGYVWKLRNPDTRTSLEELVENGTLVAYAPLGSRREVRRNLASHARYLGASRVELEAGWARIQRSIEFVDTRKLPRYAERVAPLRARHAADAKFLRVAYGVDAHVIVTEDRDYDAVDDLLCVRPPELVRLRDWARQKALALGPTMSAYVGGGVILGLAVEAFNALPPQVRWALLLGPAATLLISPELRASSAAALKGLANAVVDEAAKARAADARAMELRSELLDLIRGLRQEDGLLQPPRYGQ